VILEAIRRALDSGQWFVTRHAKWRGKIRYIEYQKLASLLPNAEILEDYPDDPRGPSALPLVYDRGKPFHAVCAVDPDGSLIMVTVYEPSMPKWLDERTRNPKGVGEP